MMMTNILFSLLVTILTFSSSSIGKDLSGNSFCPAGYDHDGYQCTRTLTASPQFRCPPGTIPEYGPAGGMTNGANDSDDDNDASGGWFRKKGIFANMMSSAGGNDGSNNRNGGGGGGRAGRSVITQCYTQDTVAAAFACPPGYTEGRNRRCSKDVTAAFTKMCPAGYERQGKTCTMVQTVDLMSTCNMGFSFQDGACTRTQVVSPKSVCPQGYKLKGGICTTRVTTAPSYKCPNNYMQSNDKCIKEDQAVASTSCPAGSQMQGRNECMSVETTAPQAICMGEQDQFGRCTISEFAAKELKCPSGYDMDVGLGLCKKCDAKNAGFVSKGGECSYEDPSFVCPAGYSKDYTADGHKREDGCVKTSTAQTIYSCPAGFEESGNGFSMRCIKTNIFVAAQSCPSGYMPNGDGCVKTTEMSMLPWCEAPYKLKNNECVKYHTSTPDRMCEQGEMDRRGNSCVMTSVQAADIKCPSGYDMSGNGCTKVTQQTVTYNCNNPALVYSSDADACVGKEEISMQKYCPKGYESSGSSCMAKTYTSAEANCASGYSLAGSMCVKTETRPKYVATGSDASATYIRANAGGAATAGTGGNMGGNMSGGGGMGGSMSGGGGGSMNGGGMGGNMNGGGMGGNMNGGGMNDGHTISSMFSHWGHSHNDNNNNKNHYGH